MKTRSNRPDPKENLWFHFTVMRYRRRSLVAGRGGSDRRRRRIRRSQYPLREILGLERKGQQCPVLFTITVQGIIDVEIPLSDLYAPILWRLMDLDFWNAEAQAIVSHNQKHSIDIDRRIATCFDRGLTGDHNIRYPSEHGKDAQ